MKETPVGQIDQKRGKIQCARCKKWNFKGTVICGWDNCSYQFPFETYKVEVVQDGIVMTNGVDIEKLGSMGIEHMAINNRVDESRVKRVGYEQYLDKINQSIRKADSEEKRNKLIEHRDRRVLPQYNKWHNTNFKS